MWAGVLTLTWRDWDMYSDWQLSSTSGQQGQSNHNGASALYWHPTLGLYPNQNTGGWLREGLDENERMRYTPMVCSLTPTSPWSSVLNMPSPTRVVYSLATIQSDVPDGGKYCNSVRTGKWTYVGFDNPNYLAIEPVSRWIYVLSMKWERNYDASAGRMPPVSQPVIGSKLTRSS